MRADDWYMHMDERKSQAIAAQWTAEKCGLLWIAGNGFYSGYGDTEDEAWSDILADALLWDEVSTAIEQGSAP